MEAELAAERLDEPSVRPVDADPHHLAGRGIRRIDLGEAVRRELVERADDIFGHPAAGEPSWLRTGRLSIDAGCIDATGVEGDPTGDALVSRKRTFVGPGRVSSHVVAHDDVEVRGAALPLTVRGLLGDRPQ